MSGGDRYLRRGGGCCMVFFTLQKSFLEKFWENGSQKQVFLHIRCLFQNFFFQNVFFFNVKLASGKHFFKYKFVFWKILFITYVRKGFFWKLIFISENVFWEYLLIRKIFFETFF